MTLSFRSLIFLFWRMTRGMTLGVRAVLLSADGQVFLVRHTYVKGWHLPGGGVDAGETCLEALARELSEEGNITLTGEARLHGLFRNTKVSPRDHVACYIARDFRQDAPFKPNREIAEARFFPLQALPEGTTRATRDRLDEILKGAPAALDW